MPSGDGVYGVVGVQLHITFAAATWVDTPSTPGVIMLVLASISYSARDSLPMAMTGRSIWMTSGSSLPIPSPLLSRRKPANRAHRYPRGQCGTGRHPEATSYQKTSTTRATSRKHSV